MEPILDGKETELSGTAMASSIGLALDDYEDIFSDFDPQPYSRRLLSEDFLRELKRASLDREEKGLVLTLEMPKAKRNPTHEKVILERLKGHFRRHYKRSLERLRARRKVGLRMVVLGVAFMFLATYLLFRFRDSLWSAFVVVLLEPAGWFTFWEGLNLVIFEAQEAVPDLGFYLQMAGARIVFDSPEEQQRSKT
jgi:hypothetical protein